VNLVTPKVADKLELLFNKSAQHRSQTEVAQQYDQIHKQQRSNLVQPD